MEARNLYDIPKVLSQPEWPEVSSDIWPLLRAKQASLPQKEALMEEFATKTEGQQIPQDSRGKREERSLKLTQDFLEKCH